MTLPIRDDVQVITEPLGGSRLSLAVQRGDVPEHWYASRPTDLATWRGRVRAVGERFSGRRWLAALQPALQPSDEAERRLRAAADNGVVVTTGQQPGLFGGPIYTFSKALSALALADELEDRLQLPVAPVFWAATDDADFEEARWTKVVIASAVRRLEIGSEGRAGAPMCDVPIGDVRAELADLTRASGSAAFAHALDAVRIAYGPGATVGSAYVELLRVILGPLGVAVLDASHAAVRAQGDPLLRDALLRASSTAAAVTERVAELREAAFEPQVPDTAELSLVFTFAGGVKRRIPVRDAPSIAHSGEPGALSPNVLLRPLVEASILPTVAYVAGPAELAYFAQVSAVADALQRDRPLALPRWSATVIEGHVSRLLRRLGVRYTDLGDPHAVEGRLARAALPQRVLEALQDLRESVHRTTTDLESDTEAGRLVAGGSVAGARRLLLDRLRRLERRYVAAVKRREAEMMREVATARAHLYPDGGRQERALNFIPMLARNGPPLIAAMRDAARSHARSLVGADALSEAGSLAPAVVEGRPR